MREEVEYVVAAIALIAAAGFLYFGFSDSTGYYSKDVSYSSVEVSPSIVSPGEYITINVNAGGKWGVNDRFRICKGNLCYSSGSLQCTGYGCRGNLNIKYRLPSDLKEGTYHVKIKDKNSNEDIRGYFEIE